ncbi:DNA-binding SARP family transcriptional activator/tetratricopeptide (TPR) repeat protein [Saccharothrix tamanrassetensis]|uniref:DNA-binding SARP family transcriptional activator/tetratricopeptide (TPR) repeat protein n=1 Tax=Saccharothrix tamanrassetensis TaxID=1051531 RepID=A0A841CQ42_9PSEU|nr:BTAD domain-containing putative transcriptional regulator [Saccharothrix tamanrassetensis]MBB5958115.1 DNA-binding SARP family transcriptional activator/tetratricopeptide (TPR) repeat protein [Saccharothrix tamanrassetensis]
MEVRIALLGEVTAHVRGQRVELGPAKQRCVLAALAVDLGRPVSVERLAERVWGEDQPRRARATLSSYVSRLRQISADVRLERRSGGYLLVADEDVVDLHRFRRLCARADRAEGDERAAALLTEALGLWHGDPLDGLDGEWAAAERDRLEQERLGVECDLTDLLLRLGRGEGLVAELSARAAEHPLDERVAAQHMLVLYRAGRAADALEHYRRLHARLVAELGVDPGAALRELHGRILNGDPALTAGAAAKPAVVPRQLPAAPEPFVGRDDELDRLDAVLDRSGGTVVISAIAGAGGIGKTWLALHWAHRHLHRFPDGQLFVDLRGFSPDGAPLATHSAVRGFLDALGTDRAKVPVEPHAQAALFRSLVADKRMLIVLDNAADTAQVADLLPGTPACTVLVTSRNRLTGLITGHSAHHVPLDMLADDEARALLADRLGAARVAAEPAAVAELVGLCGGFPLALSIVSGHAAGGLPLSALVADLREFGLGALDDGDPEASLPAVFSWSHRALTEEQAELFGLLGCAPGPDIGLPAAASLAGLPPARTRTLLRELEQASLVTRDASGRYRMHDLIRQFAAERAASLDSGPALRRLVDFYLRTAHAGNRLLHPYVTPIELDPPEPGSRPHPLADDATALTWFDAEHACLLATVDAAIAHGLHRAVWQLAWASSTYHFRRGNRHEQLMLWRHALAAAEHLADPDVRILAHRLLGRACADVDQPDEAMRHLYRALALAEDTGARADQAHTHHALTWSWIQLGDDGKAMEHATRALEIHRTLGNPAWEADALNAVGWCAARLGRHDFAREHCRAALALQRNHQDRDGEADTLDSLGYIDHQTGGYQDAVDHFTAAVALYRALDNTYQAVNTLDRLAESLRALGRPDEARKTWQEAESLYRAQQRAEEADQVRQRLAELDAAAERV